MDINIIRDHEVIKSNLKKGIKYFGEISSDNVPTGIGLVNVDDGEEGQRKKDQTYSF